jgi:hypothetical protein
MEDVGIDLSRRSDVERHLGHEVDGTQSLNDGRRGVVEISVDGGRIWPWLTRAHAAQGGVTLGPEQGEVGVEFLSSWHAGSWCQCSLVGGNADVSIFKIQPPDPRQVRRTSP